MSYYMVDLHIYSKSDQFACPSNDVSMHFQGHIEERYSSVL